MEKIPLAFAPKMECSPAAMALTRTIPIKDCIFTAANLDPLLREISSYHRKGKETFPNRYTLLISEDDTTTVSMDSPPKSFTSILGTPIRYLSLRIDSYSPNRSIEFTLHHGRDSTFNSIRLHGPDEDWVTLAYGKLSRIVADVSPQSTFLRRHEMWITFLSAPAIGWPLKNAAFQILLWMGEAKRAVWSWSLLGQHFTMAFVLGCPVAMLLFTYAAKAFPSVEIQTGPPRTWREARKRRNLRLVLMLLVVAPSANLLYDIYKFLL